MVNFIIVLSPAAIWASYRLIRYCISVYREFAIIKNLKWRWCGTRHGHERPNLFWQIIFLIMERYLFIRRYLIGTVNFQPVNCKPHCEIEAFSVMLCTHLGDAIYGVSIFSSNCPWGLAYFFAHGCLAYISTFCFIFF